MRVTTVFVVFFALYITDVAGRAFNEEKRLLDELNKLEDEVKKISKVLKDSSSDDMSGKNGKVFSEIEEVNKNAEPSQGLLKEGDIMERKKTGNEKRNAVRDNDKIWHTRDIPYLFDGGFTAQTEVENAMNIMSSKSCIKFHPRVDGENPFLYFIKSSGCWSYVGQVFSSAQQISIGSGCESTGIIMHEILHALGFWHEQSRYDRSDFVTIYWENITPGFEGNFDKYTRSQTRNLNTLYDYASIMHYSKYAFSSNGKPTIEASTDPNIALGQRNELSPVDIESLNSLYHCDETLQQDQWTAFSDFGLCHAFTSTECSRKRYRYCPGGNTCVCDKTNYDDCKVDIEECQDVDCTLDGHWNKWSDWSVCNGAECSSGTKSRTRDCDDPEPRFGGQTCPGDSTETIACTGVCPKGCTFEDDLCGYTVTQDSLWIRNNGSTRSSGTGPSTDATDNPAGYYIYTEVSGSLSADYRSELVSSEFSGSNSPQCYKFAYHMYGAAVGSLTVYVSDDSGDSEQFQWSGNQGDEWKEEEIEINKNNPFQIKFVAIRDDWSGDIALDNLYLTDGSCDSTQITSTASPSTTDTTTNSTTATPSTTKSTTKSTTATPSTTKPTIPTTTPEPYVPVTALQKFSCSFDGGSLCGMTQQVPFWADTINNDFLQWEAVDGVLGNKVVAQHTGEISFILGLEATSPGDVGRRSSIKTHEFIGVWKEYIEFYYYMYKDGTASSDIGLIEISVVNEKTGQTCEVFKTTSGRNGVWEYGRAQVYVRKDEPFSLVFTGVLGSEDAIIAIDDLRGLFIATNILKAYPSVSSPSALSCTFNTEGICFWKNNGTDPWKHSNGADDSSIALHPNDPFIFSESNANNKETVILRSPLMSTRVSYCMILYTNNLGADSKLRVNRTTFKIKRGVELVKTFSNDFSNPTGQWKERKVTLPRNIAFKIDIEAVHAPHANNQATNVLIDDIKIQEGSCTANTNGKNDDMDGDMDGELELEDLDLEDFFAW